jgi:hypothetical protein
LINNDPAKGTVVSFDVAVVLLVLVVGVGASTCYISLTADHWYWSPPAEAIVEKIDEGCSQAAIRRYFIGEMVTRTAENETMIKRRQSVFACATILVLLEVVVLLGTLALH